MNLHKRLRKHWLSQSIASRGGVPPADITSFERRHDVSLPEDLRDFLLEFDGTNGIGRTDYFRFLPLQEYTSSEGKPEMPFGTSFDIAYPDTPNGFFVFADYLHWCYGYAIQLERDASSNSIVLVGGLACPLVANSFSEFMELYLRDDMSLHP